ncbi:hypothetical protein [Nitrososphaera viennensis]|uniref:Uncharacterized protein n=2 Tax=Nitrososphaera viennensis TaxID=1034015 RepID=A0A060HSV5_9ARCH|nr:hypothetical protein [Nitrososphaera viennensis]AIC16561.1 conserved membrane protein of unknown function [Nitrososphaera viennensis EN76]UVS68494.1 hypothetical protein NWT39_11350 [Nitrososphaera viennensis]
MALEKVYYMRIVLGIIAGTIAGFVIAPGTDQGTAVGMALGIAVAFFVISIAIGRTFARGQPKEVQKKAGYDGIVPFIFMNILAMVIVYTALHQGSILK